MDREQRGLDISPGLRCSVSPAALFRRNLACHRFRQCPSRPHSLVIPTIYEFLADMRDRMRRRVAVYGQTPKPLDRQIS